MAAITSAKAYCNNEVGYLAWETDAKIADCLGFSITRVILNADGTLQRRVLPSWVAFTGQSNPDWEPQDTTVWPIQKFSWRDLTLRRIRDDLEIRDPEFRCYYEIVAVGKKAAGRIAVPPSPTASPGHYTGAPIPLFYCSDPVKTNTITVTGDFGAIGVAFNNGILSTQNLRKQLGTTGDQPPTKTQLLGHLEQPNDAIRNYLAGDILPALHALFNRADDDDLLMFAALYELDDEELLGLLKSHADRVSLILSTAGESAGSKEKDIPAHWDTTNTDARVAMHALLGQRMQDRMFNNTGHIGHNKFVVLTTRDRKPVAVFTGSTNWTPTGLGGQTNNALFIEDATVAAAYLAYWDRLHADKLAVPDPIWETNKTVQGQTLRTANRASVPCAVDAGKTKLTLWYSPNTKGVSKGKAAPVDMADVFAAIDGAKRAIFVLCFEPGTPSVIDHTVTAASKRKNLLVSGAVSEPAALPGYVKPKTKQQVTLPNGKKMTIPSPAIYTPVVGGKRLDRIMMIRAAALRGRVGDFRGELLSAGNAIIHDKIVVIDPLSAADCVVITGSHNLGYKASYANDENLLMIRGHVPLATAYAVHVLDVFEHYRFRAVQEERWIDSLTKTGQAPESDDKGGFLQTDDKWQDGYVSGKKGADRLYFL